MSFETQILFFFSALGAFNGFILSAYFAFFNKPKRVSNYFLGGLLFVVSIRIIKSVFLFFNPTISGVFIQIGLSACFLIGPFLYFYTIAATKEKSTVHKSWLYHAIPLVIIIIVMALIYPYREYISLWKKYFIKIIYLQWFIYILLSGIQIKSTLKKLFSKRRKLDDIEIWILSVFIGILIIWIAYNTTVYTSYIVGALSFSFVIYLVLLLWVFKRNKNSIFFEKQVKYANKKIEDVEAKTIAANLEKVLNEKELFKNPNLKLSDVANELNILPHHLSQFLNDNIGKSFSLFINEYRIEASKKLLLFEDKYTSEAIGYECGFNSKSTFFSTFKKITGYTPNTYKTHNS